jgi:hypothetical protein
MPRGNGFIDIVIRRETCGYKPHVDVLLMTVTEIEEQAVFGALMPGQEKWWC